jgi:hypothetical protein
MGKTGGIHAANSTSIYTLDYLMAYYKDANLPL